MSNVEVKKYRITPVKNRFVPDIIKFGRITEPGIYSLNQREVNRVKHYGHLVEEISSEDEEGSEEDEETQSDVVKPLKDNPKDMCLMSLARVGYTRLLLIS